MSAASASSRIHAECVQGEIIEGGDRHTAAPVEHWMVRARGEPETPARYMDAALDGDVNERVAE